MFLKKDLSNKLNHYGLSLLEYNMMCEKLKREPNEIEWVLFSALWSEHCSYKSSKKHLKHLFSQHRRVLHSFGENAGVVDLGEGERIAFKIESHNHPSLIDPYQGAATGVGGILRDIFTMGARPVALANYLCFGRPTSTHQRWLIDGVVRGIGGYGNCVGVPMLTGQTEFDRGYEHNILVNAFALGYFGKKDRVFLSSAYGVGYDVVYVGSQTGRDGIHGASMASKPTDDLQQVDSRPTVQIGDPFFEKLLIESCLEAMQANLIEAIQDMGASGLTSSSFEMASKGRVGMQLHLDLVPLRDATLTPEDILLSESQERMLLVCQKQNFQKLQAIFSKWDLEAKKIGQIIKEREIQIYWKGNILTKIDPDILVKQAPEYDRPYHKSTKDILFKTFFSKVSLSPKTKTDSNMIWKKLSDVQGRSRRFIFQQYDQRVGANTCRDCDYSVGVLKLPESQRDLGIVLGGRPHLMQQDVFKGGIDGVVYPALQLAIKGFEPLALTNGLNFGNPENSKVMTDFVKTVEGMNLACKALQIPIISGNVSFYNEFQGQNVIPTPAIGLVGLRKAQGRLPDDYVLEEGCAVLLLESPEICEEKGSKKPMADFVQWILDIRQLCLKDGVLSGRVVSRWGIGYTLCRLCSKPINCSLDNQNHGGLRRQGEDGPQNVKLGIQLIDNLPDLFAESFYQVILVVKPKEQDSILEKFKGQYLGQTGGKVIANRAVCWDVEQIQNAYESSWEVDFGF